MIQIGKPVAPMLVSESGSSEKKYNEIIKWHGGRTLAEIKYDGYRIQVHKNGKIELFTRNLNPLNTGLFPELEKDFRKLPSGIYDGELVGLEAGVKGFNAVKNRIGTSGLARIDQYPLQIRFFDLLMLGDRDVTREELEERRRLLMQYSDNVSVQYELGNGEQLEHRFTEVTDGGMEGLVCKKPGSEYQPGKRNKDWIKLKKFLSLDLVVLGLYEGEGKAKELPFAAMLLGTKNNGRYETISKVGISNRTLIDSIYGQIRQGVSDRPVGNVVLSKELEKRGYARKVPNLYVAPEKSAVVEVEALNISRSSNWHSCGLKNGQAYSLRIPVVKGLRTDKTYRDCNTTEQIKNIYSQ